MAKIIGNTTMTPVPRSDWNQVDETKADFILNKPDVATKSYVEDQISKIPTPDVSGQIEAHSANTSAHGDIRQAIVTAESNAKSYTDEQISAIPTPDVSGQINTHNTSASAHSDIRQLVSDAAGIAEQAQSTADTKVPLTRKVNGQALSADITLSAADVGALSADTEIPSALADLTDDSTHRVVTDAEKATWNAKSNFSGSYNDLTDKPSIPSIEGLATVAYVDGQINAIDFPVDSVNGKTGAVVLAASDVGAPTVAEMNAAIEAIPTPDVSGQINDHNVSTSAHSDIRVLIDELAERLNALANSTDEDLDQMAEIVAYIKSNKSLIDSITTSKVNVTDIVNDLVTNVTNKPLSAAQGVALKALIDGLDAADIGLGNVDNTSDANKPVSSAQATAIADAKKAGTDAQINLDTHISNKSNPHGVDLGQLGVTATATEVNYVKGVTSAIQTQLDGKAASGHTHSYSDVGAAAASHTHDDRYYTETEIDSKISTLNTAINGKAASSHSHAISEVTNLQSSLDGKASSTHTHDYLPLTGGKITGQLIIDDYGDQLVIIGDDSDSPMITFKDRNDTYGDIFIQGELELGRMYFSSAAYFDGNINTAGTIKQAGTAVSLDGHTHDGRYYTEAEIDSKISNLNTAINGKAASSHGNHVPTTQTANNAVFLRNDNTWQTVTPANIGALPSAGGTITGTTASTSTSTGALVVKGGVGIAGDIYAGLNLYVGNHIGANTIQANAVYGAVYNDYAEYRNTVEAKPGQCVLEVGNGDLKVTQERLIPGCSIVSDTFGFAIGETDNCKTPLAVAGRVLAYTDVDRYEFKAGDSVCSGPNGTVSKMTREEIREYPDCIIGIVSEIPEYETWGTSNAVVDGRIWIKLR